MVKAPPLVPAVETPMLLVLPPTCETVRTSLVSGSVSLASRPEAALTESVLFSEVVPVSATALGPSLVPVMVMVMSCVRAEISLLPLAEE